MPDLKVVDLGTKLGNSIVEFCRKGSTYFDPFPAIHPGECLGIDMQRKYERDLTERGMQFQTLDLTEEGALAWLPDADFYLAWDFLEHLPTKAWSTAVVQAAMHRARRGVWFRMPSFEQDDTTGEGVLKQHGLRFAWTHWKDHPSAYTLADIGEAIDAYNRMSGRKFNVVVRAGKRIKDTHHKNVVPIDSPIDTVTYHPELGPRKHVQLSPAVVGQWEVVCTLTS